MRQNSTMEVKIVPLAGFVIWYALDAFGPRYSRYSLGVTPNCFLNTTEK